MATLSSQKYNQWFEFIDAEVDVFEVSYTDQPAASTNTLSSTDPSIKNKRLKIGTVDAELSVYVRLVSPTAFEYVVSNEVDILEDKYSSSVQKVELG